MSTSLQVARTLFYGFQSMFADFQGITLGARSRFEQRDWQGVHTAQAARTDIYRDKVFQLVPQVQTIGGSALQSIDIWADVRRDYAQLTHQLPNGDIAESFYNSVIGKLYPHEHIDDRYAFISDCVDVFNMPADPNLLNRYALDDGWSQTARCILNDYRFDTDYVDINADIDLLLSHLAHGAKDVGPKPRCVETLEAVFYRNKGAYIVGRLVQSNNTHTPFMLALMNSEEGIYLDALITDPEEISVIFSFTRAYFMVDSPVPANIVAFLTEMMPNKKRYELYSSFGFRKHAKTAFYREMLEHLAATDDVFVEAPGIRGMVMLVFTLPSYNIVFKLIKDKFTPPKDVTEAIVREKYLLVGRHDRVGRMADTQEFNGMRLPKNRFSPELLAMLKSYAPSKLRELDDDIIIEHMYIERRMVPLNMYLTKVCDEDIDAAMREYGQAIKDLAAANIFPGDMLLKNFGVTRHKRVVFYDYDELCYLTDCNFRAIPEARTEEQEMASSPWYTVAAEDVFPEEFRLFFSGNPKARKAFEKYHADLYQPKLWQRLQAEVADGVVMDVYPYRK